MDESEKAWVLETKMNESEKALRRQPLRGESVLDETGDFLTPEEYGVESQVLYVMQKLNKQYWIIITPCMSTSYKLSPWLFADGGFPHEEKSRRPSLGLLCDALQRFKIEELDHCSLGYLSPEQTKYIDSVVLSIKEKKTSEF